MKGLEIVEWEKHLNIKTRTLDYEFVCCRERHNFFTNRVAHSWNMLPSNMINFSNLNGFKADLENFTENGHWGTLSGLTDISARISSL